MTFIPLVKTIGYEFSVINGILLFVVSGLYFILSRRESSFNANISDYYDYYFLIITGLIPLLIGLASTLIQTDCPIFNGIMFYFAISIPSLIFGFILGIFCTVIATKFRILLFIVFNLILLFQTLIEFYYNPQIYFYNPIFGFFPGTIYDEDLTVTGTLIAYRIFDLSIFILIYFFSKKLKTHFVKKSIVLLITSLLFIIFWLMKPTLTFATDESRINKNLTQIITTENFTIHSSKQTEDDSDIKFSPSLHEYYFDKAINELNIKSVKKIESFIFKNRDQKRKIFGSGNADVAKPWLNQIYLNQENYERTLNHEIAHVIAAKFGVTPFKVADNLNPAMIEGLAMAIENDFDGNPIHFAAKLAYKSEYKFKIEKLFSGFNFFTSFPATAYIYAGSFIKFLIEKYGIEKVKRLYGDMNFNKIYSKDLKTLAGEYELFLEEYSINYNKNKAQLYFGGKSIFKKFCPRMAAADVNSAWGHFNNKEIKTAYNLFEKVYEYSGSYQSLVGMLACYSEEKKYSEAQKLLEGQISKFKSSQYYFNLELMLGDLYVRTYNPSEAKIIYDLLLAQNPHINYTNEVDVRKTFLDEGVDSLIAYFERNKEQRILKLISLNNMEINYSSIPILLAYANKKNKSVEDFILFIQNRINVKDYKSSYASMMISKHLLREMNLTLAQSFAVKSLNYKSDFNTDYESIENLKMINWFINNSSVIKITVQND